MGHDILALTTNNEWECQKACQDNDNCKFWTLAKSIKKCHLKNGKSIDKTNNPNLISGPKKCPGKVAFAERKKKPWQISTYNFFKKSR